MYIDQEARDSLLESIKDIMADSYYVELKKKINSIPVDDSPKFKAGDEVWWLHIDEIGCGKLMEIRENRFSKEVDIVSTSRFVNLEYKFMFKTEEEAKQALRDKEK